MAPTEDQLPWIPAPGSPPHGAGICLSGGGLRAAYFGLGAIQQLQLERELLFGQRSADYLSVVSGGSYIASTFVLNAEHLAEGESQSPEPPLAPGTPEEAHVLQGGRYLIEDGWPTTLWRFGWRGIVNFLSLVALFNLELA